jgi:anthrone oxygenase-like protein
MMYEVLLVLTVVLAGLMVGNELNVGLFLHPTLRHLPDNLHARARRDFAALFGRLMPFWYIAVALLLIAVTWLGPSLHSLSGQLLLASTALFLLTIVYTIILPAPLNSKIAAWQLESVPSNWRAQERRWDTLHAIRMFLLVAALFCLVVAAVSAN